MTVYEYINENENTMNSKYISLLRESWHIQMEKEMPIAELFNEGEYDGK